MVEVKTEVYKSERAYQHDIAKKRQQGWKVMSAVVDRPRKKLFALREPKPHILVTYERGEG